MPAERKHEDRFLSRRTRQALPCSCLITVTAYQEMKSNIQIAQEAEALPIDKVGRRLGLRKKELIHYGRGMAKMSLSVMDRLGARSDGRLILVTSINPTRGGEGKTTQAIGITQALARIRKRASVCLREPSLAPVFGIKGGGCGAGYSQVIPMDEINLHFTGDIHAVGSANNLLAAMIDNHIFFGNELGIDSVGLNWNRSVDMSDRLLRKVTVGQGQSRPGVEHVTGFQVTAASEVMAIMGMTDGFRDLKKRLGKIVFGFSRDGKPLTAKDLKAHGSMATLLKDALHPNLVQTIEGVPAFVHGGPFANIADGCNSIISTRMALKLSDYVVTEAGFGSDLGAEKFLDIKCRVGKMTPHAVVVIATLRALRHHGGAEDVHQPNLEATRTGFANLAHHVGNISAFGLPAVVAINMFPGDEMQRKELEWLVVECGKLGVGCHLSSVYMRGGAGGIEVARDLVRLSEERSRVSYCYPIRASLADKAERIARRVYGGDGITLSKTAREKIEQLEQLGYGKFPVVMAKTQYSLTSDPNIRGAPTGFKVPIRDIRVQAGAGTVVMLCGSMLTMPGLPRHPAAEKIDILPDGTIKGLF